MKRFVAHFQKFLRIQNSRKGCGQVEVTIKNLSKVWFSARADKTGSTPGDAVFCFLVVPFFLCFVSVINTIFPFDLFSFILTADPAGHAFGSVYIFSLSPKFYFGNGISKAVDLHTGQAYDQKKP